MFPDDATVKRFAYLEQEVYHNATARAWFPLALAKTSRRTSKRSIIANLNAARAL